jgi:hypothetical protein
MMPTNPDRTRIARLFRETGAAHHRAFAATDGDDPDWPRWYAGHLAEPLSRLLGVELEALGLEADLKAVEAEHGAQAPDSDWASYYADWFLAHRSHG